jgi:hypothetical protein
MLLRNVVEQVTKRNWLAVAIELLIVIIGVFLGLQAQEWNQQREDRKREHAYIERLTVDFSTIRGDLKRCRAVYRDSIEAINLVSQVVEDQIGSNSTPVVEENDSLSSALIRMTAGDIPAGRSTTFVEMLSTGDLGIVRDVALREALVAYDERAQVNRELWRSLRAELSSYGHPLYDNIKVNVHLDEEQISSISDYDLEAMSQEPGFRSMLNALIGMKGNIYELCLAQLDNVDKVERLLEAQP